MDILTSAAPREDRIQSGLRCRIWPAVLFAILVLAPVAFAQPQSSLVDCGRTALAQGRLDTAVDVLQRAVAQQPASAEAHYWLGNAYGRLALKANVFRRLSLAKKTRQEFERAVELDPENIDARFALVQFYTMAPNLVGGSLEKACQQAAEIAARNPDKGKMAAEFVQTHGRSGGMPQSLSDPAAQQAMHGQPH